MAVDIYQSVTDKIVTALESGVAPWVKPWGSAAPGEGLDRNFSSQRTYNGANLLVLWAQRAIKGYSQTQWLTFNQARELGGSVCKGEKGTQIVFWKIGKAETDEGDEKSYAFARAYTVFNVEQCSGLAVEPVDAQDAPSLPERLHTVQQFCDATQAKIVHGGNHAGYSRDRDQVLMPARSQFKSDEHYYATLLHELTHWTGHKSRLDREYGKRFGDEAYAVEELVAELGAAFACAALGLDSDLRHEGYLEHWLRVLKADKRAIFTCASAARKAHEYLVGLQADAQKAA